MYLDGQLYSLFRYRAKNSLNESVGSSKGARVIVILSNWANSFSEVTMNGIFFHRESDTLSRTPTEWSLKLRFTGIAKARTFRRERVVE